VIGTVRKFHKVSDKPASTLGFWTPVSFQKRAHPTGRWWHAVAQQSKWQVAR